MDRIKEKRGIKAQTQKPSIKITVSADIPESSICSSPESPSQSAVSKRLVISGDEMKQDGCAADGDTSGANNSLARVTVDDSVIEFNNCNDFGIRDFLCNKDEIDLELSSDTDTSFLEAAPPHRFSDSELESQIEIMSITLDTALNLGPKPASWNNMLRTASKDDLFTVDLRLQNGISQNSMAELESKSSKGENTTKEDQKSSAGDSGKNGSRRLPPPRPFRRHISLPASIFMRYLLAEQNQANKSSGGNHNDNGILNPSNAMTSKDRNYDDSWNSLNRKNDVFATRKLTKIDGSYSSQDSTDETFNNQDCASSSGAASEHSGSAQIYTNSELDRKESLSVDDELDGDDLTKQAFTSEIERKSLVLRYMRRLIRQDTTGNFAPPDYCI